MKNKESLIKIQNHQNRGLCPSNSEFIEAGIPTTLDARTDAACGPFVYCKTSEKLEIVVDRYWTKLGLKLTLVWVASPAEGGDADG